MAKAKTPGTKAKRGSKEAVVTNNPATVLDPVITSVPASVQPQPEANAEVKASPDVQVGAESNTQVEPKVNTESKLYTEPRTNTEARGNSDSKIFEVRKADGRKNLIPINLEDEIRRRAYELSQQRQPGSGGAADDWLAAEREVMQRYHQQSA